MSAQAPRLLLCDVHKDFAVDGRSVTVLTGVSLELGAGEALAVTGPSGSGKSTLLHLVGALDRPSSGRLEIDGRDPWALSEPDLARFRNRTVGFVFQRAHLLPQYSVLENVMLPALAFPDRTESPQHRATELLGRVGLSHRLGHRPSQLSGGEQQRVAVARALVNRPALLLCDEPTGSLDRTTALSVEEVLFDLHRHEAATLLVVTHSLELAARCPRRLELRDGRCYAP